MSSLEDKSEKSYNKNIPVYSAFLDLHEQNLLYANRKNLKQDFVLFGGYPDAERKIACFLPDYMALPEENSVSVVRSIVLGKEKLTHRDFLGAIMGLGIKREQIGDIIISDNHADILVKPEMADFLCNNLLKAGRANLSCSVLSLNDVEFKVPEPKETKIISASSLRLDKICAEGFKISRTDAVAFIESGKVFVNQKETLKPDFKLEEGDKITLRGKGKICLSAINGVSKKGKLRAEFKIW